MAFTFRFLLSAAAVLCLAHGAPAAAQPGQDPPYPPLAGADAEAIRAVVREYQQAASRRDGAATSRLVTRDTRGYYARMRDLAVYAPEGAVRAMPLMDRVMVLMYRHRVPADELRAMVADSAFAYTIDSGWVSGDLGDDVASQGEIYGEGDLAILRLAGEDIHFLREDGAWRWDMVPMLQAASAEFAPDPDSGMTEDEFLMFILRYSNGTEPSPDIWRPLP
ncbi:MAG TPA: hypothetical protein VGC13_14000 [Longimicrobium sp.]|jgi:hypothetical protein|uniref:hypothetical protein n=1 Tax=Longimicrobium sp. TaxID=2029185 RepID=UPI002ED9C557